jgi:hypothetical protein
MRSPFPIFERRWIPFSFATSYSCWRVRSS